MNFSQNFGNCNENFVYLNKIFYNNQENASPIMAALDTTAGFTQQLTIGQNICSQGPQTRAGSCGCGCGNDSGCGCGCGNDSGCGCGCGNIPYTSCNCCCDVAITADTTFDITNSYVIVRAFQLTAAAELTAADVTVEGIPITAITRNGNQYVGDLSTIMEEITKCNCQPPCSHICPGNFVMITTAGPWTLAATIVLEGTIYNGGPSCQFKLCYNTLPATPLDITGSATFAFCNANIPCQTSGISPSLIFDFDACAKLLSPEVTVTCTGDVCVPVLTGSLVITPEVNMQVTRPSLFNLGDREVMLPCDDLGQCNPCNPIEAPCIDVIDTCCCGQDTQQIQKQNQHCTACQYCDTNGFGF